MEKKLNDFILSENLRQLERHLQIIPRIGTNDNLGSQTCAEVDVQCLTNTNQLSDNDSNDIRNLLQYSSELDAEFLEFSLKNLSNIKTENKLMPRIGTCCNLSNPTIVEYPESHHHPILERNSLGAIHNISSYEDSLQDKYKLQEVGNLSTNKGGKTSELIHLSRNFSSKKIKDFELTSDLQFLSNRICNPDAISLSTSNQTQDFRICEGGNSFLNGTCNPAAISLSTSNQTQDFRIGEGGNSIRNRSWYPTAVSLSASNQCQDFRICEEGKSFQNWICNPNAVSLSTRNHTQHFRNSEAVNSILNTDKKTNGEKSQHLNSLANYKIALNGSKYSEKTEQLVKLDNHISRICMDASPTNTVHSRPDQYPLLKYLLTTNNPKTTDDTSLNYESRKEGDNSENMSLDVITKTIEQNFQLNKSASLTVDNKLKNSGSLNFEQFICDFCSKALSTKDSLKRHNRIHTKQKPFVCKICDRRFTNSDSLKRHMPTHSNEKPFTCNICRKAFAQKRYVLRHKQMLHADFSE